MTHLFVPILLIVSGCSFGQHVENDGEYPTLFPKTPLSEAPCLEDQDCVVTHLKDGQCCPDPITEASNLYSKDQFEKLVSHQKVVCNDKQDTYTCPEPPKPGHIEYVYQGACVEQRCVKKKVPADAPHNPPLTGTNDKPPASEAAPEATTIETAASPKAD